MKSEFFNNNDFLMTEKSLGWNYCWNFVFKNVQFMVCIMNFMLMFYYFCKGGITYTWMITVQGFTGFSHDPEMM
jgi:hypothetical protein